MLTRPLPLMFGPRGGGRLRPALDLNFLAGGSLDSRITFSRASAGTYFDRNGVMQTAAAGSPRFDFDPATLQPRGLLIEEQRTNLAFPSADFTAWGTYGGVISVTGDTTAAPDGTVAADTITDNDTSINPFCYKNFAVPNDSGTHTLSVYLKQGTATQTTLRLSFQGGTSVNRDCVVDWAAKTATVAGGATAARLEPASGGWYRASVTGANNGSGNTTAQCQIQPATASSSATGSVIAWGAQLEAGAFPTSFIPATSAAATRSADVATMALSSIPGWSGSEGTIFSDGVAPGGVGSSVAGIIQLDDGTASNRIIVYRSTGRQMTAFAQVGGASVATIGGATVADLAAYKIALAWATGDYAFSVNGAAALTGSGAVPPMTTIRLGDGTGGAGKLNGWLRRLRLYGKRQPDAVLQGMTT